MSLISFCSFNNSTCYVAFFFGLVLYCVLRDYFIFIFLMNKLKFREVKILV